MDRKPFTLKHKPYWKPEKPENTLKRLCKRSTLNFMMGTAGELSTKSGQHKELINVLIYNSALQTMAALQMAANKCLKNVM